MEMLKSFAWSRKLYFATEKGSCALISGVRRSGGQTRRWSRNHRTLRGVSSWEQETSKKWFWRVALLLSRGVLFLLLLLLLALSLHYHSPSSEPVLTETSRDFSPRSSSSSRGFLREIEEGGGKEVSIARRRRHLSDRHPSPVSILT